MRRLVPLMALGLLIVGATPAPSRHRSTQVLERAQLPGIARELLASRMREHQVDVADLLHSVLVLDHARTVDVALAIAEDDQLARPLPDDAATLNALLPPKFFDLEDQLRSSARQLAAAARKNDDAGIAAAFGTVAQTCVACHASYMNDPAPPAK